MSTTLPASAAATWLGGSGKKPRALAGYCLEEPAEPAERFGSPAPAVSFAPAPPVGGLFPE
eukprot:7346445-Lingulodinium_polyedra.AAC.1